MNRAEAETRNVNGFSLDRIPAAALCPGDEKDWLVWQLVDSALPTGGFAHSYGLEAAWQHGEIRNQDELVSYLDASLEQLGRASLPFVTAAYASPEKFDEFDSLCDVFITNHVANRASRLQGKAFLRVVGRIICQRQASPRSPSDSSKLKTGWVPDPRFGHIAPIFGACLNPLKILRETGLRMFLFSHLRGALAAAVRLNIVGPMEAQWLQHGLSPTAEKILHKCESLSLDDIAQTAPLLDLWQGAQDRLYSRLFQS